MHDILIILPVYKCLFERETEKMRLLTKQIFFHTFLSTRAFASSINNNQHN